MKQVSIIIPIYNAETTLKRCLLSIKNQTYTDFEVLLINDGSKDNSANICKEFCEEDARFKLFNQSNAGPSAARNKGIENSDSKYLMFIDSDDWIEEDTIEQFYYSAEKNNADITICSYFIDYKTGSKKHKSTNCKPGVYTGEALRNIAINSICSSVDATHAYSCIRFVKKECMNGYRFNTNICRSEDYLLWTKMFFNIKSVNFISDKFLYHYCMSENSITHSYIKNYFSMVKTIYSELLTTLPNETLIVEKINCAFIQRAYVAMRNAAYADHLKLFLCDLKDIFNDKVLKESVKSLTEKTVPKHAILSFRLLKLKLYPILYLIYLYKYIKFHK